MQLPEGRHDTRVELLDEFVSFGWAHFATCGRRATGGWATQDALFAVIPRYKDIDGEEFQVTFLGHEAQHLADKQRFPGMESWELEHRAKLTELVLARTTRARVLEKFTESQGDDPSAPHPYANKRVLEAVRAQLDRDANASSFDLNVVPIDAMQGAVTAALLADSRRREAARWRRAPQRRAAIAAGRLVIARRCFDGTSGSGATGVHSHATSRPPTPHCDPVDRGVL